MMKKVNFFFYRKGKIRQFDVKPQIVAKAKEKKSRFRVHGKKSHKESGKTILWK